MSHEQSETVQKNGRWVNVYGRKTKKAGQPLPVQPGYGERSSYSSVEDAAGMAALRSALHGFEQPHDDEDETNRQGGMNVRYRF
jgi:hypothetical protein